ncbi:hypothetical protein [Marinobacter mangrovi]|uniref:hypothetical protein n=1 Tax=Marinobacter mangrovi TaxID=2803918 RepID=UPI001F3A6992|nr:hypothetical protein [Marinobacter mangrovi]
MKRLLMTVVLLTGSVGVAHAHGDHHRHRDHDYRDDHDYRHDHHDRYDHDVVEYREYRVYRDLPPGLRKKVHRGRGLPPGWHRKLHRGGYLPVAYDRYWEVRHVDRHYDRVHIEDKVYRVIRDTREIVDILNNS